MANRQKYTRAAIGHLCAHYAREKDKDDNYIKFGNQDIDVTRTHLNYNLAEEDQKMKQQDFINKRIKDLSCMNRKDVNVMITWVVTLPQEMNGKSDEEKERFFRKSYNFLKNRYGAENVISAYVHMDEGQPHMHFAFTPVMYDQKKGRYKFDAKRVGSRQDLQTFHKDFDKHLEREMGYKTGVINGITEINLSTKELKEVQKRMAEIDRELSRIHSKTPQKGVLGYKKDEVEILVKENKLLRQKAILVARESEVAKETNKTIQREIEKIRTSAPVKKRIELVSAINGLKTQLNDVMLENANLENENMELREKVSSLETELNVLKEFFNKVIDFFRTQARDVIEKFKKYLPQDLSKRVDEALKQREHEFWREAMYVEPEFESQEFERDDYDEFER
jgi:hypothetical protein